MKRVIKKIGKDSINITIKVGKRALDINPRLKDKLKAQIVSNIRVPSQESLDEYSEWLKKNTLDAIQLYRQSEEAKGFKYQPLISIVVPIYNTPEVFFREMVESVLSQTYRKWELVMVDDASPDDNSRKLVKEYAKKDERITYKLLKTNHHIAGATNEGIKVAKGEFISLLDHDDILWPNALFEVVKALNKNKKLNFIYSDEDKIDGDNRFVHRDPFFKPDWNFDLLRSINYITHFTTIRKSILDEFGYEDGDYNGTQDWELFLRVTRNIDESTIYHIPTILYSWRVHENSTAKIVGVKPYVYKAQEKALIDDLSARGIKGAKVSRDRVTDFWSIRYPINNSPLVSIIIPTKNLYKMVKKCVDSIYQKSTYANFEVILVDTGSDDQDVIGWYERVKKQYNNLKVVSFVEDKFSFARSCNYGAEQAKGSLLVMLNNDIEITTSDWIEQMAGYAQRPEVGAVGVKLYYPRGKVIQHAGVGVGMGGNAANLFQMTSTDDALTLNQASMLNCIRNISAVTAACLMVRAGVFKKTGGFTEKYRINYNDVDICLRILEVGLKNVYLPGVSLIHHESISRGLPNTKGHDGAEFKEAQEAFKKDWKKYIAHDPAINPNFRKDTASFDVKA